MPSSTSLPASSSPPRRLAALWTGVLAGPLAWSAQLEAMYVLSYVACEQRATWMLHLCTAASLAAVAIGAILAWRARTADPRDRLSHFMATGGLIFCVFFAIVILATGIPPLLLDPCSW
jgi:hypothetical protein